MRTVSHDEWQGHQKVESGFWGNCVNTFEEETKQMVYATKMGLNAVKGPYGRYPSYDLKGRSVIDIGGGPCSLLLKSINAGAMVVVDPLPVPQWVTARYTCHGIRHACYACENLFSAECEADEVWIYNVLQHVRDPQVVIEKAMRALKPDGVLRMFEWIDIPTSPGHPHVLSWKELDEWIGAEGVSKVGQINENGAVGRAYFGVFPKKG